MKELYQLVPRHIVTEFRPLHVVVSCAREELTHRFISDGWRVSLVRDDCRHSVEAIRRHLGTVPDVIVAMRIDADWINDMMRRNRNVLLIHFPGYDSRLLLRYSVTLSNRRLVWTNDRTFADRFADSIVGYPHNDRYWMHSDRYWMRHDWYWMVKRLNELLAHQQAHRAIPLH